MRVRGGEQKLQSALVIIRRAGSDNESGVELMFQPSETFPLKPRRFCTVEFERMWNILCAGFHKRLMVCMVQILP